VLQNVFVLLMKTVLEVISVYEEWLVLSRV